MKTENSNTIIDNLKKELHKNRLESQRVNKQLAVLVTQQSQKLELVKTLKTELLKLELKKDINEIVQGIGRLVRMIDHNEAIEVNWDQFSIFFDRANQDFLKRLIEKHPQLTPKDQKICAFLRLNLSTKEIAPLLNISIRGVEISRYRLRKKLALNNEQNLVEFLIGI